jgi:hypothetical protein
MKNIPQAYLSTIVLVVLTTANFGGLISAGTIHDLRWVKVFAHAVNRYVFAPISFHPCVKLGPEQS